jgi:uncharacterized protein YndB with AHSA1/START domain
MNTEAAAATMAPIKTPTPPEFVYVTYIRSTMDKVFAALTQPEFTRAYWCQITQESTWQPGSPWIVKAPDGRIADTGEVLEYNPPSRFAVSWRHEIKPEAKTSGFSHCAFDLEPAGDAVKLTIIHSIGTMDPADAATAKFFASIGGGWPAVLASLKSYLETGEPLEATKYWPKGM